MFAKYSSLENHSNSKIINKIRDEGHTIWDKIWVAREKIHGANFSVIITKESISFAKRSGPIEPTESFFDYENVMSRYMTGFKSLQSSLTKLDSHIQIFGELAGKGIQKEVDYGDKDFYVFDIIDNGVYLNDFVVSFICRNAGLKMAPLIDSGSFDDLIKLPNDFQSLVNEYNEVWDPVKAANNKETKFELKAGTDNITEGYVLKPVKYTELTNGNRVAIKCKNSKFSEKKKSDKLIQPEAHLSENDVALLQALLEFNTWNRVLNVVSHLGEINAKMFGRVMGLTCQDILVEAEREGIDINTAEMPSLVKKRLTTEVQNTIRSQWSELL